MAPKGIFHFIQMLVLGVLSLQASMSPRLVYALTATGLSKVAGVPVHCPFRPNQIDVYLCWLSFTLMLLLAFYCRRAVDLVGEPPLPLEFALVAALLMPAWIGPIVDVFGTCAVAFGVAYWFASAASALAFIIGAAQIQTERMGQRPGTMALGIVYHLGGACGLGLLRLRYPGSRACDEVASKPPLVFGLFVAALVFAVINRLP
jgi:hypothetical protein